MIRSSIMIWVGHQRWW